jgi:hypothetical protein
MPTKTYSWLMPKTCDYKEPGVDKICGDQATWIADVGWIRDEKVTDPAYKGTSWNVALCEKHYDLLLNSGRITGTARKA